MVKIENLMDITSLIIVSYELLLKTINHIQCIILVFMKSLIHVLRYNFLILSLGKIISNFIFSLKEIFRQLCK